MNDFSEYSKTTDVFESLTDKNIENITPIITRNSMPLFNLMSTVHVPSEINPIFFFMYTPRNKESFQTIAYKFYKDIKLWWLICKINNIQDSTNGADLNTPLKIIYPKYVNAILTSIL